MAQAVTFSISQVRKLMQETHGSLTQMSGLLHCGKPSLANFISAHPALAEELALTKQAAPDPSAFRTDVDEMRVVLVRTAGSIKRTAEAYQITPNTLHDFIEKHPELKEDLKQIRLAVVEDNRFNPPTNLVLDAIEAINGNMAALSKQFKVSRATFQQYVNEHPEVQEALYSAKEGMLDMVETSLYRQALAGEGWAVCFMLKTQGRKRGYIERGESFNLNVNLDNLSIEQLERLATGEHPSLVLGGAPTSPASARSETVDALAIEGTGDFSAEEETG